jgi:protein SCO1
MTTKERIVTVVMLGTVVILGVITLWVWSLGFSAFTSYSYALEKAGPLPRPAPNLLLIDQFGEEVRLASLRGHYVLLHVFYGSCQTVCPIVIAQLGEIYSELTEAQRSRLVLVSVTIDPRHDTADHRLELWREVGSSPGWMVAEPARPSVGQMARELGIWVFARTDGTFNHSADLFLIDPYGRIVRVISPQWDTEGTRQQLAKYL